MTVRICLLVTDDADDHQAFSEALSEYEEIVVIVVLDSEKALRLLKANIYFPDYIFIDLSMYGLKINTFLRIIKNEIDSNPVSVIVLGEESDFAKIDHSGKLLLFNKDFDYSELKKFLTDLIKRTENMC